MNQVEHIKKKKNQVQRLELTEAQRKAYEAALGINIEDYVYSIDVNGTEKAIVNQSEIESLKKSNVTLNGTLAKKIKENEEVMEKLNSMYSEQEIEGIIQHELTDRDNTIIKKDTEIAELNKKVKRLESESQVGILERSLAQEKTLTSSQKQKIEQLEADKKGLEREIEKLKAVKEQSTPAIQQEDGNDKEIKHLKGKINDLEIEKGILENDKTELQKVINSIPGLQAQIQQQQTNYNALNQDYIKLQSENTRLTQQINELKSNSTSPVESQEEMVAKADFTVLKEKLEETEARVIELESDLQFANQVKDKALEEIKKIKASTTSTSESAPTSETEEHKYSDEDYRNLDAEFNEYKQTHGYTAEDLEYAKNVVREEIQGNGTQQASGQTSRVRKMNLSKADTVIDGINYKAEAEKYKKLYYEEVSKKEKVTEDGNEMISGTNKERWIQQGIAMIEEEMKKGYSYLQAKNNVLMKLKSTSRKMQM